MFCIFTSIPGEMIQFDEQIFERGWFNHQLDFMLFDGFAGERHRKEGQGVSVQCPAEVPGEKKLPV